MGEQSSLVETLAQVVAQLKLVTAKLDLLVECNSEFLQLLSSKKSFSDPQADVLTLLKLPVSLRETAMALYRFEKATADDIAKVTGKLRTRESALANQLVRLGYVKKKRQGHRAYFSIQSEMELVK